SGLVILATHHHPDHVEGLPRFQELAPDAAPPTAPPAEVTTVVAAGPLVIRAHPTPGHTSDSVCFVAECGGESVVLTGDTILGRGTTVVAHPDGDLGQYLDSL